MGEVKNHCQIQTTLLKGGSVNIISVILWDKKNIIKVDLFFTENISPGSSCFYSSKTDQPYRFLSRFHVISPVTSKLVPTSHGISHFKVPLSMLNYFFYPQHLFVLLTCFFELYCLHQLYVNYFQFQPWWLTYIFFRFQFFSSVSTDIFMSMIQSHLKF